MDHQAKNFEYIRDQIEIIIPVTVYLAPTPQPGSPPIQTHIIRDALLPELQEVFDEVVGITLKTESYMSERDAKIQTAKNLELAYRLEDAAQVYEELEMWEEAGRLRKQLTRKTTMSIDVNRLLEQLKKGGISTSYDCPKCGASMPIDGKTDPQGLKFCSFCGSGIKTHDLIEVLQKVI